MVGKIKKTVGLAFLALAALSALSASAQAGSFDIGAQPAVVTGHSEVDQLDHFVLQKTNGSVFPATCTHSLEGTTQGMQDVTEITVTTTKTNCTFLGLNATVRMNGCKDTLTGAGQAANTFLLDIVGCTAATPYISIQVTGCQLRIPEQTGLSHVVATNLGNPHNGQVTLSTTTSNITVHQVGLACPDGNNHKGTRATSQGNMIISASQDVGHHQVTEHGHQFDKVTDGAAVGITST